MSHSTHSALRPSVNPVAISSFSVAICALAASPLALVFKDFPGVGLAAVGGFYLVVGVISHVFAAPAANATLVIGGHAASADNLVAEAVTRDANPSSREKTLVSSSR